MFLNALHVSVIIFSVGPCISLDLLFYQQRSKMGVLMHCTILVVLVMHCSTEHGLIIIPEVIKRVWYLVKDLVQGFKHILIAFKLLLSTSKQTKEIQSSKVHLINILKHQQAIRA